jgi:hypothetical protein
MAGISATFNGYMDDFASARSDALKAIDAYDQCSNTGTLVLP